MNWKLTAQIAITHLVTKRRQSLIAMLGVTFGISMFIIMISFMTGVNQFLEDLAMDNTPHVHIYNPITIRKKALIPAASPNSWTVVEHQKPGNDRPRIKDGLLLMQRIERMPGVLGAAPQVSSQVFFNNGPVQVSGNILGVDVGKQIALFDLQKKMDAGDILDLMKSANVLIMGSGLAAKMGVGIGDRVRVTTPEGNPLTLKIAGLFSFGMAMLDDSRCYATMATVQRLLQQDPAYVTDLNIKMTDVHDAVPFRKRMEAELNQVKVEDWVMANASILAGDAIRNVLTAVVCITLLTVAGFGIYNIMNMNIINKMKDIAILKATGFEGKDITAIFLLQSLIIGLSGGLLGIMIGFVFSYLISLLPFPEGSFLRIKTFPVNFKPIHYGVGLLFGFLTTLFAGYFPAKKAASVDPVQIIRG